MPASAVTLLQGELWPIRPSPLCFHALDERPDLRWSEGHAEQLGYDLSTVRRSFKRQLGMTFLEMARQRRLRDGLPRRCDLTISGGRVDCHP